MSRLNDRHSLAKLTAEERLALFEQLQRQKKEQGSRSPATIQRQNRTTHLFPLSFAQQRLWFLDQFEPDTPLYNIPQALRVYGCLSMKAVSFALESIVARHETLRTIFVTVAEEPRQMITDTMSLPMPLIDLCTLPEAARQ